MSQIAAWDLAPAIRAAAQTKPRLLVAITGAPGSGKSTLAQALAEELGQEAAVIPMDGFHRDNDWLELHGLLNRKGAPETFDAAGFCNFITDLSEGQASTYPLFDRDRDCTLPDAGKIHPNTRIFLVEGNYLLLNYPIWRNLAPLWDLTISLDIPMSTLRSRLIQRWIDHGLSQKAAVTRALSNDLANARLVVGNSVAATYQIG
ncbi:MAG: phosphoribulokinase [Mangrovicoccus sp.]